MGTIYIEPVENNSRTSFVAHCGDHRFQFVKEFLCNGFTSVAARPAKDDVNAMVLLLCPHFDETVDHFATDDLYQLDAVLPSFVADVFHARATTLQTDKRRRRDDIDGMDALVSLAAIHVHRRIFSPGVGRNSIVKKRRNLIHSWHVFQLNAQFQVEKNFNCFVG